MYRWASVALIVCSTGLVILLYKGLNIDFRSLPSMAVGSKAHDFQLSCLDQSTSPVEPRCHLDTHLGKMVVLNFWASWCVSCREEARELESFWQQHYSEQQVVVLGIAIQDTVEAALAFAKKFGKTYPLALDELGSVSIDYGVTGVPETFIISAEGYVVKKFTGPVTRAMLEEVIFDKE